MREEIISPPRTIMEVFRMLPEGTLAEVIENRLYMSPTPSTEHQRLITNLLTQIHEHARRNNLGEVFPAPLDVFLDEYSNAVQPDILYIPNEKNHIVRENSVNGVPDFIIEVFLPGNKKHDQVVKKSLYEKVGVTEYWIVDPETRQATGFTLKEGTYELIAETTGKITSPLLRATFTF